jgi:hypothetical protein
LFDRGLLGHRQTKGAATDKPDLLPPRHISTLPWLDGQTAQLIALNLPFEMAVATS